jgi:hypothetical protein
MRPDGSRAPPPRGGGPRGHGGVARVRDRRRDPPADGLHVVRPGIFRVDAADEVFAHAQGGPSFGVEGQRRHRVGQALQFGHRPHGYPGRGLLVHGVDRDAGVVEDKDAVRLKAVRQNPAGERLADARARCSAAVSSSLPYARPGRSTTATIARRPPDGPDAEPLGFSPSDSTTSLTSLASVQPPSPTPPWLSSGSASRAGRPWGLRRYPPPSSRSPNWIYQSTAKLSGVAFSVKIATRLTKSLVGNRYMLGVGRKAWSVPPKRRRSLRAPGRLVAEGRRGVGAGGR